MINRECKICGTNFSVTTKGNAKIYCTKNCKKIADKQRLKLKYDLNPREASKKVRESYFKNHDENKAKMRERAKQARKLNPSLYKKHRLKSNYGLSAEHYSRMLESQKSKCAICFKEISGEVNTKDLKAVVDHNHKSGIVRGILCLSCNSIVGYSREDRKVLLAAIDYLKKFGK
jgi:endogenous inhibitor of DNA gyrase (YacG/DUF329 family)